MVKKLKGIERLKRCLEKTKKNGKKWREKVIEGDNLPKTTFVMYLPRRAVLRNRERPLPALGITSLLEKDGVKYHHLYIDIDDKSRIEDVLRVYEAFVEYDYPTVLLETKKGYHIRVYYPFRWQEVLKILSSIKWLVDPKWLNLQRKRKLIIIRIAGKYHRLDIRQLSSWYPSGKQLYKYALKYHLFLFIVSHEYHRLPQQIIWDYFEKVVREGETVCLKSK